MRISKSDKILLIILGIVVVLAAYYFLLLVPQEEKIENLQADLKLKEAMKDTVRLKIASEKRLDKSIEDINTSILSVSGKYYTQMTQEEMLAKVSRLNEGLPLNFSEITFTDNMSDQANYEKYLAQISFVGDYDSIMSYVRNLRQNDQKIILRELVLNNSFEEGLQGNLVVEFNTVPVLDTYSATYEQLVAAVANSRDTLMSPFTPYEGFTTPEETTEMVNLEPIPEFVTEEEDVDYENYRPKTQIYGFEEGNNFFVANSEDIKGTLTRSKTKIAGGYSADLTFDFASGRDFSEANIVFEGSPILLTKQADYIGLWVYAYEASNHKMGVVIIDSKGKEFKVELASMIDFTQWQELEVLMPVEISYPCMIQRIYVEGIGYDQKLTGKYLFDQLEVSYPVQ